MLICMRTTIRLDDYLLAEAKMYAARKGVTLTAVIEDALRQTLAQQDQVESGKPVRLSTVTGNGLQPGVDLDDSAALLAIMDESSDSF